MTELAIMIKTFMRSDCLTTCINSIEKYLKDLSYHIYISDDGPIDNTKQVLYEKLEKDGHFILKLPEPVGIPAGKNALIPFIKEDYILCLDDDMILTEETDILKMKTLLAGIDKLGVISDLERQGPAGKGVSEGEIRKQGQGFLYKLGKTLVLRIFNSDNVEYLNHDSINYFICDYARNFKLIKKDVLKDTKWEGKLKTEWEHMDFYLGVKKHTRWKVGFTPDSIHLHAGPPSTVLSEEYLKNRYPEDDRWPIFASKWGINHLVRVKDSWSAPKKILVGILRGYYYHYRARFLNEYR